MTRYFLLALLSAFSALCSPSFAASECTGSTSYLDCNCDREKADEMSKDQSPSAVEERKKILQALGKNEAGRMEKEGSDFANGLAAYRSWKRTYDQLDNPMWPKKTHNENRSEPRRFACVFGRAYRYMDFRYLPTEGLSKLDFSGACLRRATLRGMRLSGTSFESANLYGADLTCAELRSTDFSGAILEKSKLQSADLQKASFRDANLSRVDMDGAFIGQSDFLRAIFEPIGNPSVQDMLSVENLETVFYVFSPDGLARLRESLKKGALVRSAQELSYAIKNSAWLGSDSLLQKWGLEFVFFKAPGAWGLSPWRPLFLISIGIIVFGALYLTLAAAGFGDVARVYAGQTEVRWVQNPLGFFHFSLVSAFSVGWGGVNSRSFIGKMKHDVYEYRADGWVRPLSVAQTVISAYLLAVWIIVYTPIGKVLD